MIRLLIILLMISRMSLPGQPHQQFVDSYNLRNHANAMGLTSVILEAVQNGTLPIYNYNERKAEILSYADIRDKLIQYEAPIYEAWDSTMGYYITGDRVMYEGQLWEATADVQSDIEPEEGDFWARTQSYDIYFQPQDISILKIQYTKSRNKRLHHWVHMEVPAESTPEALNRYLFSIRYDDLERFLDQVSIVFYELLLPELGLVNENIFSFDDLIQQAKLKSELCRFAYDGKNNCRVYLSLDNLKALLEKEYMQTMGPFSAESYGYETKLRFTWNKNIIDTVGLYISSENRHMRVADIPFASFINKMKAAKAVTFKGFQDFSAAIGKGILQAFDTDTLITTTAETTVPTGFKPKAITNLYTVQRWEYLLQETGNQRLLQNGNEFGQYILNAIASGKFEGEHKAYANDSLKTPLSQVAIQERIIKQLAPEFPMWDKGAEYYTSDIVSYNGKHYECNIDHWSTESPDKSSERWRLLQIEHTLYAPQDFNNYYLYYKTIINAKGQVVQRQPVAITILVFDELTLFYKPIMTLDMDTMKKILNNSSMGTTGAMYWNSIINETLTGFHLDNSPIRKLN